MSSETYYLKELKDLQCRKCEICGGLGVCDDAEPGDIYCNMWPCEACGGTGLKKLKKSNSDGKESI